jgi:Fic family protein
MSLTSGIRPKPYPGAHGQGGRVPRKNPLSVAKVDFHVGRATREEATIAAWIERRWAPDDAANLSRKDRAAGIYRAFVPDELGPVLPRIGPEAQQAAEDALTVLARADERIGSASRYLSHLLIRSESISSSWIEGNRVTPKRLAIAELLETGPRVALDVIANVRATEAAIAQLSDTTRDVTVADIEALQHSIEPRLECGVRREQNWVGGAGFSPLRADFVPPPEGEVPRLLTDLAQFVTATEGNPVVRAAVAHAQFETIHPFVDGNGRTGRALIHTVLKRSDAVRNILIPISTVFAGNTTSYIAGLTDYRAEPPRLDSWVIAFASAAEAAAQNAVRLASDVQDLAESTLQQLVAHRQEAGVSPAKPRRGAVSLSILGGLAAEPVLTIAGTASRYGVSATAAQRALAELGDAGILRRNKDHKGRVICWSADPYLDLVTLTERSNRVGGGDTAGRKPRSAPPLPRT